MRSSALSCLILAALGSLMGVAMAAKPSPTKHSTARPIDKNRVELLFRELKMWPTNLKIVISNPEPSPIAGLYTVIVSADAGNGITLNDQLLVSKDGQYLLYAMPIDVQHGLFYQQLQKLQLRNQPTSGDPNAIVTLVVFTDFECPFCKAEASMLREHLPSAYPKGVRVIFADYPLTGVHPWSESAALAGRCIYQQDTNAFWNYYDWVFANQELLSDSTFSRKLVDFAVDRHLDSAKLAACQTDKDTMQSVQRTVALAHTLNVQSLPAIFINGRKLENPTWPEVKRVIDFELTVPAIDAACGCGEPQNLGPTVP